VPRTPTISGCLALARVCLLRGLVAFLCARGARMHDVDDLPQLHGVRALQALTVLLPTPFAAGGDEPVAHETAVDRGARVGASSSRRSVPTPGTHRVRLRAADRWSALQRLVDALERVLVVELQRALTFGSIVVKLAQSVLIRIILTDRYSARIVACVWPVEARSVVGVQNSDGVRVQVSDPLMRPSRSTH
jgi:hypothetical protein